MRSQISESLPDGETLHGNVTLVDSLCSSYKADHRP